MAETNPQNPNSRSSKLKEGAKQALAIGTIGAVGALGAGKLAGMDDDPAAPHFESENTATYVVQSGDTADGLGNYAEEHVDGVEGNDDYRSFVDHIDDQAPNGLEAGVTEVQLPKVLDENPDQEGVQLPPPEERQ